MAKSYKIASNTESVGDHEERISSLELWRERVTGALAMLAFLIGSGVVGTIILNLLF